MFQSERIKEIKNKFSLTTGELAQKIGITTRTLGGYERNERKASAELVEALFIHLNINPEWFFTGEGEMIYKSSKQVIQDYKSVITFYSNIIEEICYEENILLTFTQKIKLTLYIVEEKHLECIKNRTHWIPLLKPKFIRDGGKETLKQNIKNIIDIIKNV